MQNSKFLSIFICALALALVMSACSGQVADEITTQDASALDLSIEAPTQEESDTIGGSSEEEKTRGEEKPDSEATTAATAEATTAAPTTAAPTTAAPTSGSFSSSSAAISTPYGTIRPGNSFSSYSFGTPVGVTQAQSCHFDGMDNIYSYSGFTVYTYMNGSSEIIYSVETSSGSTPAGVRVGDSVSKVLSVYGNGYSSMNDYSIQYSASGVTLYFSLASGAVTSIEAYV